MCWTVDIDFNGPFSDSRHRLRIGLQIVTNLVIPEDLFFGRITLQRRTEFESRNGGVSRPLTKHDWDEANAYIYKDSERFEKLSRPTAGAVRASRRIAHAGHFIRVVSDFETFGPEFIGGWLRAKQISHHQIIPTKGRPKAEHFRDCHRAVENQKRNFCGLTPSDTRRLILLQEEEDESADPLPGIIRASSWDEALPHILN